MSSPKNTKPESFSMDDPHLQDDDYCFEDEKSAQQQVDEELNALSQKTKSFAWLSFLFSLFSSLLMLGFSLWVFRLYNQAKALHPWMGWLTLGLFSLLVLSLSLLAFREFYSLLKFRSVKKIRLITDKALSHNNRGLALKAAAKISQLYKNRAAMAAPISRLHEQQQQQLDAHAILSLSENYLLAPLDEKAQKIIQQAGRQVAFSTALSRMMLLDVIIVFFSCWRMMRRLAELYGLRPSKLGLWRLFMQIFTHLIITGGMAAGEDILGSVFGSGMAGKISSRLGEGVINGLLTCRVGLIALDYCRPMPYLEHKKPKLRDIAQAFLSKPQI